MSKGRPPKALEGPEQVYAAALRYLARREYAEQELRLRLLRRGAAEDVTEAVISRLKEGGWLSQERFAASRVRLRRDLSGRGRAAVRAELKALGVDEELSQAALAEEYDEEREAALAEDLAAKALSGLENITDRQLRLKKVRSIQRRLLSRGFGPGLVRSVTEKYLHDQEDD